MKKFFTRGEFAQLRNINMNSLRYYEKLGLLQPQYIDPETNYHYYTPEQLPVLDTITLAVDLGIPLKDLQKYIDEQGNLLNRKLVEDGQRIAVEKMNAIQLGIKKIEYTLRFLEENQAHEQERGFYKREIEQRRIVVSKLEKSIDDAEAVSLLSGKLYQYAQDHGLAPVLPAGVMFLYGASGIESYVYFEIVSMCSDERVLRIPKAVFDCVQVPRNASLSALVNEYQHSGPYKTILVANMLLDKYQYQMHKSEFQMLTTPLIGNSPLD